MRHLIPYGGLVIAGGSQTQSLTTTVTAISAFSASGGANSASDTYSVDGDPGVRPDYANNRILVGSPGVYEVHAEVSGVLDSAGDVVVQVMKNATAVADLKTAQRWGTTENTQVCSGILNVTVADNPGTVQTFANPSTSGFAGAGGAPKMEVPITLGLGMASGAQVATLKQCRFTIKRLG